MVARARVTKWSSWGFVKIRHISKMHIYITRVGFSSLNILKATQKNIKIQELKDYIYSNYQ